VAPTTEARLNRAISRLHAVFAPYRRRRRARRTGAGEADGPGLVPSGAMAPRESERWRVDPARPVRLADVDTRSKRGAPGDEAATRAVLPAFHARFHGLQERLFAERKRSLLMVLQAMDAGGKDGTINHVFRGANPQGVRVTPFKAPTDDELEHDFLWRVHKVTPGAGEIGTFNRSHYEDVVAVRVRKLVPEDIWRDRYRHIVAFEENLTAAGTTVIKLFLHISKEE
jgi:polyphosphate kinase 2 (PPK2 family)